MALIKCKNCGSDISSHSTDCIHCGTLIIEKKEMKKPDNYMILKILYTIVLWVFWPMVSDSLFGNSYFGIIVQGVVQIGGTILIWKKPKVKEDN